ncbi:MAG: carbohydrate porin [Chlamydiales bacterium]
MPNFRWICIVLIFNTLALFAKEEESYAIGSNPAMNILVGTGALGRRLGIKPETGIRLGGLWIVNGNTIPIGGSGVDKWTANNLLILDLYLDMEKMAHWKGATFGIEFLQFNGQNTNAGTGAVQGFNSIIASPPFERTELYQAWYRQSFNDVLFIRIGKTVASYDFNNVVRAFIYANPAFNISSLSGLLYTPIFVNSSLLGVLPAYYDSAYGITITAAVTKDRYISFAAYDGNLARGIPTGERGPQFNGYYFYIGEAGIGWELGKEKKPGKLGVGGWRQTGVLTASNDLRERGTEGIYAFASQRLWYHNWGKDNSGISAFCQYGINDSKTLTMNQYIGFGATAFGLTRLKDSFGWGIAIARLNPNLYPRKWEPMFQAYYQAYLFASNYLQPTLTFIPKPGSISDASATWAGTLQLTSSF